jgi:TPR repeat protein
VPQSDTEAAQHYRAAAEQGQPRAMCYLGDMFMWGKGVDTSDLDAYRWHVAAVAAGDDRCRSHVEVSAKKLSRDTRAAAERDGLELARRYAQSGLSRGR